MSDRGPGCGAGTPDGLYSQPRAGPLPAVRYSWTGRRVLSYCPATPTNWTYMRMHSRGARFPCALASTVVLLLTGCSDLGEGGAATRLETHSARPMGQPGTSSQVESRPAQRSTSAGALRTPEHSTSPMTTPRAARASSQFLNGHFFYTDRFTIEGSSDQPIHGTVSWSILATPRKGSFQTITYYLGDEAKATTTVDQWRWFTDKREIVSRGGRHRSRCDWNPPVVDLMLGARSGSAWSGGSQCSVKQDGQELTANLLYSFAVGSPSERAVPGRGKQQTWPIHGRYDLTYTTPQGAVRQVLTLDEDLLPGFVIPLHEVERVVTSQPNSKTSTQTSTRDLKSA